MTIYSSRNKTPVHSPSKIEMALCASDPLYFFSKYLTILNEDGAKCPLILYGYQEKMLNHIEDNKNLICVAPRRSGSTLIPLAYLLWNALFGTGGNTVVAVRDTNAKTSIMMLLNRWYNELPTWMNLTQTAMGFEVRSTNTRILVCTGDGKSARGCGISTLFVDNLAHFDPQVQHDLWSTVAPALTATGKIILTGAPRGSTNAFANIWKSASAGGAFTRLHITASDVYNYQELQALKSMMSQRDFQREVEGSFVA